MYIALEGRFLHTCSCDITKNTRKLYCVKDGWSNTHIHVHVQTFMYSLWQCCLH